MHYDGGIPQGWGPGPWDHDGPDLAYRAGDLRAWTPGDPLDGDRTANRPAPSVIKVRAVHAPETPESHTE